MARGRLPDGTQLSVEWTYVDIVEARRIVYASTLHGGGKLATASLTTVELDAVDGATRLTLTEQAAYLDGQEDPAWRERGTGSWLDALGTELTRSAGSRG